MKDFFSRIKGLGEFRCNRDLRRLRTKDRKKLTKSERHSIGATLGHHGACLNGQYHHCDFDLKQDIHKVVIYYWRVIEMGGIRVRVRGREPMKNFGRGRPPVRWKSKR